MSIIKKNNKKLGVFIFLVLLLYFLKPRLLFQKNGKIREFGCGFSMDNYERKTLFHMSNIIIFIAISITIFYDY